MIAKEITIQIPEGLEISPVAKVVLQQAVLLNMDFRFRDKQNFARGKTWKMENNWQIGTKDGVLF